MTKHLVDLPKDQIDPWANCIGGLIINFGSIESITYIWFDIIGASHSYFSFCKKPLAERIDSIIDFVHQSKLSTPDKHKAEMLWREAKTLTAFRNRIAHNPLNLAHDAVTKKVLLTIHDLSKRRTSNDPKGEYEFQAINHQEIKKHALRVRQITLELDEIIATQSKTPIAAA